MNDQEKLLLPTPLDPRPSTWLIGISPIRKILDQGLTKLSSSTLPRWEPKWASFKDRSSGWSLSLKGFWPSKILQGLTTTTNSMDSQQLPDMLSLHIGEEVPDRLPARRSLPMTTGGLQEIQGLLTTKSLQTSAFTVTQSTTKVCRP